MREILRGMALTALICGFSAEDAAAQDVAGQLAACAAMSDATQRLACFDALTRPAQPPTETTTTQMPAQLPAASELRREEFGAEQIPREGDAAAPDDDSITAGVTNISVTPFGRFVLTLDNGQMWRQIDGDTARVVPTTSLSRSSVLIWHGTLGSYNLQFAGHNALYKVRRVK